MKIIEKRIFKWKHELSSNIYEMILNILHEVQLIIFFSIVVVFLSVYSRQRKNLSIHFQRKNKLEIMQSRRMLVLSYFRMETLIISGIEKMVILRLSRNTQLKRHSNIDLHIIQMLHHSQISKSMSNILLQPNTYDHIKYMPSKLYNLGRNKEKLDIS